MKKWNRMILMGTIICAAVWSLPAAVQAQWSAGVSYEMKQKALESGFGLRLERFLLQQSPVNLRLRGHFSHFGRNYQSSGSTVHDFGLAGIAGVSLGWLKPYAGAGLSAVKAEFLAAEALSENSSLSYTDDLLLTANGFLGAELGIFPGIRPFAEYRFQGTGYMNRNPRQRMSFGVSVAF